MGDELVAQSGPNRRVLTPKGSDNIAQGNALGKRSEGLGQVAMSQAFSLPSLLAANLGRCPRLSYPSPSG